MKCPKCQTENVDKAKFCNECGHSFIPPTRESLLSSLPTVDKPEENFDFSDIDPRQTADLSGLEKLVDSSYVPPEQSARMGNTMELPKVEEESSNSKAFLAALDPKELKRQQKEQAKLEKQQAKEDKKAHLSEEEIAQRASRKRVLLVALIATVVLSACAVWGTYSMEMWGGKTVPNVIGESEENAQFVLEQKGFSTRSMLVKSDEVAGLVLLTDPANGRRAPEGSEIVLHISTPRVIPDIVGLTQDEATALITAEGFSAVEYVQVKSNDEEGIILSVSPEAGTEGKSNTPIVIEVTQAYTVPETADLTREEAVAALEAEGYSVTVKWHYDEEATENTVYATEPEAGTKLNSGSDVTLYINMKRSTVLISETKAYLNSTSNFSIGGVNYEVSSVDSVSYSGNNTTAYSITARPFETYYWFGSIPDTRYGEYTTITGSITWNDSNQITSADPSIKKL